MKRFLFLLTALLSAAALSNAQTAEDSVKAAVNKFFEGFKNADAAMVQSVLSDSAILQTVVQNAAGVVSIRNEKASGIANVVSQQQKGDLDERIQFEKVLIDGPMAIAWTPYKFYYKGQFSHCGVNCFQMVKFNGAWKINFLIDTRRRQGCE